MLVYHSNRPLPKWKLSPLCIQPNNQMNSPVTIDSSLSECCCQLWDKTLWLKGENVALAGPKKNRAGMFFWGNEFIGINRGELVPTLVYFCVLLSQNILKLTDLVYLLGRAQFSLFSLYGFVENQTVVLLWILAILLCSSSAMTKYCF